MKKFLLLLLLPILSHAQTIKVLYVDSAGNNQIAAIALAHVALTGKYADVASTPSLNTYAPLASAALTTPTSTTPALLDNSTKVATTAFVVTNIITKCTPVAINSSATATAAQLGGGWITSTSAAATTITLPTATLIATQIGGAQGTRFPFTIDNTAGANIVTVAVSTGITAVSQVTGGTTLTVPIGKQATFFLTFSSATVAELGRIQ